jgi:hypothetical protein
MGSESSRKGGVVKRESDLAGHAFEPMLGHLFSTFISVCGLSLSTHAFHSDYGSVKFPGCILDADLP